MKTTPWSMNRSARSHKKGTIFWEFIVHSHEKKKHPQTWYNIMNMNTTKVMRHRSIKLIILHTHTCPHSDWGHHYLFLILPSGIHTYFSTPIGVYWIRIKLIGKRYLELEYNMITIGDMWLYLCPTIFVHTIPILMRIWI